MGVNDPRGMASLDPRGIVGRIYVEDNITLLHTKSISSWPHDLEKIFEGSLAVQLYTNICPLGRGQFRPQGLDWQD